MNGLCFPERKGVVREGSDHGEGLGSEGRMVRFEGEFRENDEREGSGELEHSSGDEEDDALHGESSHGDKKEKKKKRGKKNKKGRKPQPGGMSGLAGIASYFSDFGTCMMGWSVPCMLYGKTQYRLKQMAQGEDPLDAHAHEICNGPCWMWCLMGSLRFDCKLTLTYNSSKCAGIVLSVLTLNQGP
jgi:hypothetical protein